jgi:hypothetical protein
MSEDRVQVTPELIEAGRSIRGGWSRGQLALLGEDWPPIVGWKQRAMERTITYADAVVFRQGREAASAGPGNRHGRCNSHPGTVRLYYPLSILSCAHNEQPDRNDCCRPGSGILP